MELQPACPKSEAGEVRRTASTPVVSASRPTDTQAYEIQEHLCSLLVVRLKRTDLRAIELQLAKDLPTLPDLLGEPIVLDLQDLSVSEAAVDFPVLLTLLRKLGLAPIGVCNATEQQRSAARGFGLVAFPGGPVIPGPSMPPSAQTQELARPNSNGVAPAAAPSVRRDGGATHLINAPVRTGQRVFSGEGDLTILASVNPGAEVLAAGSIHVYGPLRGRAPAGVTGDTKARIFTSCMDAELVSIAGCYRMFEDKLGPELQGKPVQIYLDRERIMIAPVK
jgi:septum site-determining protein MinC